LSTWVCAFSAGQPDFRLHEGVETVKIAKKTIEAIAMERCFFKITVLKGAKNDAVKDKNH